jgi:hypothetical protein
MVSRNDSVDQRISVGEGEEEADDDDGMVMMNRI